VSHPESPDDHRPAGLDEIEYGHQMVLLEDAYLKIQEDWFNRRRAAVHPAPALRAIFLNTIAGADEHCDAEGAILAMAVVFEDLMYMSYMLGRHCEKHDIKPLECTCFEYKWPKEDPDGSAQSSED